MARLLSGSVSVEGVRIAYHRTGGEKPPVILLHGFTDNGLCWNRIPQELEPAYDVIMTDARGHGESGLDERGAGVAVQAADVRAVIQSLGLVQPILIGHSMGADVAALTAAQNPGLVRAVVLEDPPWPYVEKERVFDSGRHSTEERKASILKTRTTPQEDLIAVGKQSNPGWDESEFSQWARAKQQVNPQIAELFSQERPHWTEIVEQIHCPGLVFTGDNTRGAIVTPQAAALIKVKWPQAQVVHLSGAGHNIRREQYAAYMQALNGFLAGLAQAQQG